MTLSSILVLLQLAVALLSTPNLTPAQQTQVNAFASQAVQLATQALGALPADTNTLTSSQPVQSTVQPTSGQGYLITIQPTQPAPVGTGGVGGVPLPVKSCSIQAYPIPVQPVCDRCTWTAAPGYEVVWSSTGLPDSAVGRLYYTLKVDGGIPVYESEPLGVKLNGPNGDVTGVFQSPFYRAAFNDGTSRGEFTFCETEVNQFPKGWTSWKTQ